MPRIFSTELIANYQFSITVPLDSTLAKPAHTFHLALRGPDVVDVVGVLENSAVTYTGTLTAFGKYSYVAFAVDADDVRMLIDKGDVEVKRDPMTISLDEDLRTHAEKMLAAIEAVLQNKATKDQLSYTINGRSITHYDFEQLERLRDKYKEEVKNQGKRLPRAVLYHFGSR